MAANILVRTFKVPFSDHQSIDISVDRQVFRVMERLGFVERGTKDKFVFIYAAREAYPDFPGIFDKILWDIGKEVCRPRTPLCGECQLADLCRYANTTQIPGRVRA